MIEIKITNTQFNVFYPRNTAIRQKLFVLEGKLGECFQTPFNLIPVPDDAPSEIPRIVATSKRGHSQLNIGLDNAGLTTTYDENFSSQWDQCRSYVERRIENFIPVLEELSNGIFLFSGLVVRAELPLEDDPVQLLINRFFSIKSFSNPFDIEFKITFTLDNTYYINISFSNVRYFEGVSTPENLSPAFLNLHGFGINIVLDINDKYGFNFEKGYTSSRERQRELFNLATRIIKKDLSVILEKGEFQI